MGVVRFLITTLISVVTFVAFALFIAFETKLLYYPVARAIDDSVPAANSEYDFIIVGGGTGGATLAARLSENPKFKVLLLEAGPQDNSLLIKIPALFSKLFKSKYDWNFHTVPQDKYGEGRVHYWPRGKVLGGCSSINANIHMRGPKEDYDEWDRILGGNSGWSADEIWKYFEKCPIPAYQPAPSDVHDINRQVVQSLHKFFNIPIKNVFTGKEHTPSVGYNDRTVLNGVRASSSEIYLTPEVVKRPNLHIKTEAFVTKVLFDNNAKGDQKRVSGVRVDFKRGKTVQTVELKARKEVILAAGAVQTPQLLMVSGVGDAKILQKHNIPVVVENDQVGQNLQDHYIVGIMLAINQKTSLHILDENPLELLSAVGQWLLRRTGLLASNGAELNGLFHSNIAKQKAEQLPDFQFVGMAGLYDEHSLISHPGLHGFSIGNVLLRPKSRGYISISSNSTYDHPVIDPNYFSDPERDDITRLVDAYKTMRKVVKTTEPISKLVSSEVVLGDHVITDEAIEEGIKKKGLTLYHPVGTAAMGKVTTNQLKVIGVENLRVADASVMPKIIGANTNLPTFMIAEKAADLIKQEYAA